jgi:sugar phosphate isomerase/epimerase
MRFSFNCFNHSVHLGLPPTLPAQIAAAARAGYEHVGLDVPSLLAHETEGLPLPAVHDELKTNGISCFEIVPLSLDADRHGATEAVRVLARVASGVGAQHVLATVRCEVNSDLVNNLRLAVDSLYEIGVSLSVEFMPTSPLPSLDDAVRLLDAAADERIGVVIDIWHFVLSGSPWSTLERLPVERIGFVQLDDAPADVVGRSLHDSMHRRLLPGEGTLPIGRFHDVLAENGYDGVVSVEVLAETWRDKPIADFADATLAAARRSWGSTPAR